MLFSPFFFGCVLSYLCPGSWLPSCVVCARAISLSAGRYHMTRLGQKSDLSTRWSSNKAIIQQGKWKKKNQQGHPSQLNYLDS
jgi:hypothetical protein|tara:strand:- start:231 stop:479 length:249 start_codon:yes stop_codon:yes gene_type:complete